MRALLIFGLAAVTLLTFPEGGGLQAESLLRNGGFEDGREGWNVQYGSLDPVTEPVAEGSRAARLTDTGGPAVRAVQHVPLQPGGTYRLTGQALVDDPNAQYLRLKIAWGAGAEGEEEVVRGPTWGYRTVSVTAEVPCGSSEGQVALVLLRQPSAASAYGYVDDLRLESVGPVQPCHTPTQPPTSTLPVPPAQPTSGAPSRGTPTPSRGVGPGPEAEAAPTPSHGLVVNGGFEAAEDGQPVGWRAYGGVLARVAQPTHGGRYAGGFSSATESTKWVYQTVPVTPGDWFELAAYVHMNDVRVEAAFLRVSWYAGTDGSGRAVATADSTAILETPGSRYRRLTTGPVQAPPGVHSAKVRILLRPRAAASAVIYIDDVSFHPTGPAPAGEGDAANGGSSGRSSGSGNSSGVLGESVGRGAGLATPMPSPVIVRRSPLRAESEPSSSSGPPWWSWALLGGFVAAGAVGTGAWWWRKRRGTA